MADLSMIVRMVIYKCRELSNPVTETLAAYVAQTTLNPRKYSEIFLICLLYRFRDGTILLGEPDLRGRGQRTRRYHHQPPIAARAAIPQ